MNQQITQRKMNTISKLFMFLFFLGSFTLVGQAPSINYKINFATAATNTPSGFIEDSGAAFGLKGNGLTYGWVLASNGNPINVANRARNRAPNPDADPIRETLIHMEYLGTSPATNWQIQVPNGTYQVTIQAGDANAEGSDQVQHLIKAEGETIINHSPNGSFGTRTAFKDVTVSDGLLTIDGAAGFNAKINAVIIQSKDGNTTPSILGSVPVDGATDVDLNSNISANFIGFTNFINGGTTGIDNSSITNATVKLFKVNGNTSTPVSISVNGTGGGDAINISLSTSTLEANTRYRYVIDGVEDVTGTEFFPFSAEFITGSSSSNPSGGSLDDIAFTNVGEVATGRYTTLTFGPDGKLYGLALLGEIHRWNVNGDGTLSNKQVLTGITDTYGTRASIGLAFAPTATANNLVAYVTHSSNPATFGDGEAYGGSLSKLTGANLQNEQEILTNLPRSIKDHFALSLAFDPNDPNVLYFNQGSNSAAGEPDGGWGFRKERLLTAANLKLDLSKLPNNLPLDVKCSENQNVLNNANTNSPTMSDGSYNPYYVNAPLTLFATGIRNAYDLLWHSNGQLYIPTNGTGGNSNSPASVQGTRRPDGSFYNGPNIPALFGNQTQRDFLYRINPNEPLGYYGHPNPLRGEYVLNRAKVDENDYPSSIQPDANYRGIAFDFEFNKSPNGIIEYQSPGPLQGAMIVCRYSGGSDLIVLVPDGPNGDIGTSKIGIPGFSGLFNPLDLIEDVNTGNIYVSDFGENGILLLKPGNDVVVDNGINLSFTTPTNGTNLQTGTSLDVEIAASSSNGNISNVKLYLNNQLVRQENGAPYQWGFPTQNDPLLENLAAGTYTLKAVATDNVGDTKEASIMVNVGASSGGLNISFSSPEDGDVFLVGQDLDIEIFANNNSLVGNIKLYLNNQLVRQENGAPYQWGFPTQNDPLLENLSPGTYELKAIATTVGGGTVQESITISVLPSNNNLSISFAEPLDGANYNIGDDIEVTVNASDNSLVSNIKLYVNNQFVRKENGAPYEWSVGNQNDPLLQNMAAGTYELKAIAKKVGGGTVQSIISISVQNLSADFFQHCTYGGNSISLGIGEYPDFFNLGLGNNSLSSLKVPAGLIVTLYNGTNFNGASISFTSNDGCLNNNNFNDKASSLKIEAIGADDRSSSQAMVLSGEFGPKTQVYWVFEQKADKMVRQFSVLHGTAEDTPLQEVGIITAEDDIGVGVYKFLHHNAQVGKNHYQIKVEYENGSIFYPMWGDISFGATPLLLNIAPNPASNYLKVDVSRYMDEKIRYSISTTQGIVVINGMLEASHNKTVELDLTDFRNGMYILHLRPENHRAIATKFMVGKDY